MPLPYMKISTSTPHDILRFFIYYDTKAKEFVGVSIDVGIVTTGENPYFVERDLTEATLGYVETVHKEKLPLSLLHQHPPQKYMDIFSNFMRTTSGKKAPQSSVAYTFNDARTFVKHIPDLCHAIG